MVSCERCGTALPEDAVNAGVCPTCGATLSSHPGDDRPDTPASGGLQERGHNRFSTPGFETYIPGPRPLSDRMYTSYAASNKEGSLPSEEEGRGAKDTPDQPPPSTPSAPFNPDYRHTFRFSDFSTRIFNTTLTGPEIVEALLSLFLGIYGVGWLLAGEVPVGILLLIGSVLLYLPLVVVSFILAIATVGLSLLCTGPLAIGAICLNLFLLHNRVKRRQEPGRPRGSPVQYTQDG